jgi:hypothetical protein
MDAQGHFGHRHRPLTRTFQIPGLDSNSAASTVKSEMDVLGRG